MATLFGGLAEEDRSGYALELFPGASYTAGWDATHNSSHRPGGGSNTTTPERRIEPTNLDSEAKN